MTTNKQNIMSNYPNIPDDCIGRQGCPWNEHDEDDELTPEEQEYMALCLEESYDSECRIPAKEISRRAMRTIMRARKRKQERKNSTKI